MFLPGHILLDIHPKTYSHHLPGSLKHFRSIEDIKVDEFKKIYLPNIGPESIATYDGKLVTGSIDGTIYLIQNNSAKELIKIVDTKPNGKWNNSRSDCILGLKFDSKGVLFAVLPYHGVYKVENLFTKTPKVSLVLDNDLIVAVTGTSKFLNDLAIEEKPNGNQVLYITDLSSRFNIEEALMVMLSSDTSGRILRFDITNNKLDTIIENLFAPNGIEIVKDNSAILFSEFATRSVWKYNLQGEMKSKVKRIMANLPAEVDNIRISATGQTYWLAMTNPRSLKQPSELDFYMKKPLLRKLILRTLHLVGTLFDYANRIFMSNDFLAQLTYDLKNVQGMHLLGNLFSSIGGMILEIDQDGNILNSIYSHSPDFGTITEVRETKSNNPNLRILYLGSYIHSYVRKMVISA